MRKSSWICVFFLLCVVLFHGSIAATKFISKTESIGIWIVRFVCSQLYSFIFWLWSSHFGVGVYTQHRTIMVFIWVVCLAKLSHEECFVFIHCLYTDFSSCREKALLHFPTDSNARTSYRLGVLRLRARARTRLCKWMRTFFVVVFIEQYTCTFVCKMCSISIFSYFLFAFVCVFCICMFFFLFFFYISLSLFVFSFF